jgi:cell division protein FtsI/penicillin-binding protein 2
MKKAIFALILFLFLILPEAMAQDTSDEELESEILTMSTPPGAEYRLLQLELSLSNQIDTANHILEEINASEEVQALLAGQIETLELLLQRIQGLELSGTAAELAAEFVAIKAQAIEATQAFRRTALGVTPRERALQIKEKVRQSQEPRLNALRARLEESREYMYMKWLSGLMQADNAIEKHELGEITREQARAMVSNSYMGLRAEQKRNLSLTLDEHRAEALQQMEAKRATAKERIEQKTSEIKANLGQAGIGGQNRRGN